MAQTEASRKSVPAMAFCSKQKKQNSNNGSLANAATTSDKIKKTM
jgi:hypothetical protein